jgi:hypothetical protein
MEFSRHMVRRAAKCDCSQISEVQPIRWECFKQCAQFPEGLKSSYKKKWELTLKDLFDYYNDYCKAIGFQGEEPKNRAMMQYTAFQKDLETIARSGCCKALLPK